MAGAYDDDEVEIPDAVLARLVPRKANGWIFAALAAEFVEGVLEIAAESVHSVVTILHQRFNYEQDRREMFEEVSKEIESIESVEEVFGASTS